MYLGAAGFAVQAISLIAFALVSRSTIAETGKPVTILLVIASMGALLSWEYPSSVLSVLAAVVLLYSIGAGFLYVLNRRLRSHQ